ncbi:response regulator [Sphingomonas sp. CCH5-D11]|jgi:two-component system response regulator AdeR|uniref:response regulator n=1 Tax=Sphingomonas sp. CCH5-D11 TaxID=1768786 RepID=UPI0008352DB1|nr:response regulator [Sphingomonas sp. CCH5-D11]
MAENALILVAEDESQIAEVLIAYLEREGFRTVHASDGRIALDHHSMLNPDLVLLDIKLPKLDGLAVLSQLRRTSDTPVIMVTALKEDLDKLLALRVGADDYVVKPFNPLEVVARVRTVLRRTRGQQSTRALRVGALEIDRVAHHAQVSVKEARTSLDLTPTEFRILVHMAETPRKAFTRSELIDACLPEGEAVERTVDSHISNLRRKIADAGGGEMMESVRGIGYRLEALS